MSIYKLSSHSYLNRTLDLFLYAFIVTALWTPSTENVESSLRNRAFHCLKNSLKINEKIRSSIQLLWRQPAISVPFRWYICSGETLSACLGDKTPIETFAISKMANFQIQEDGLLFWPKISYLLVK